MNVIPAFLADRENRKRRGELDNENRIGASVHMYNNDDDVHEPDDDDDEVVLETKGSSPPAQPTPMEQTQAQIELERARDQLQQETAARAAAQKEADRLATVEKARPIQSQAYNSALGYGNQQIAARGFDQGLVDKYGLLNLYDTDINNQKLGIADDDLNPMASYNTNTTFNDALNTALGAYRGDLTKQLNQITPDDFSYNVFGDTADDSILQSILDQNKSDAQAQIDAAKARGQLNDAGYTRALASLGQQGQSAMADLQDLGGGVLSGYRDQLNALRSGMADKIGTASFNDPLSFDTFTNRLNQTESDLNNRLSGDIYRAADGQSFFDPSTIISSSGALQGFYNPSNTKPAGNVANPLLDAFTTDEKKKNAQPNAGALGNGVF